MQGAKTKGGMGEEKPRVMDLKCEKVLEDD